MTLGYAMQRLRSIGSSFATCGRSLRYFAIGAAVLTALFDPATAAAANVRGTTADLTLGGCAAAIITPNPPQVCSNSSFNSASGAAGMSGYSWSIINGTLTGATNSQTITYNAGFSGTVGLTLAVTDAGGNPSCGSIHVPIVATPATPTITPGGPTLFCAGGSVTLTSNSASSNQWYLDGNPIGGATDQTYIATAAGNYAVIATSMGYSGTVSAPITVTVNPLPPTPTITPGGPTTFCAGGSVTLTSSSSSGNQWYLGGNPIAGANNQTFAAGASGNYSVSAMTSGCPSAHSANTAISANPLPSAGITAPSSIITGTAANASVPSAGVGAAYVWSICNGSINGASTGSSINFTAGVPGMMTLGVAVTDGNSCMATGAATPTVAAAQADLNVTKSDGRDSAVIGGAVTYLITAFNSGPSPAPNTAISDTPPAGCTSYTWSCAGAFGGTCTAAGNGAINDTANLPVCSRMDSNERTSARLAVYPRATALTR
jgi:uncharacterized repeat protein (TIGR01451 family)